MSTIWLDTELPFDFASGANPFDETKAVRVHHPTLGWGTKSADGAFFTDDHGVVHPIRGAEGYDPVRAGEKPKEPKPSANDVVREKIAKLPNLGGYAPNPQGTALTQLRNQLIRITATGAFASEMTRADAKRQAREHYRTLRAHGFTHEEVVRALVMGRASGIGNIAGVDRDLHKALSEDRIYKDDVLSDERHSVISGDFNAEGLAENKVRDAKEAASSQGEHMLKDPSTFPEFTRPELTALQDLIKRDGALYPKGDQTVWDEHLAAVIKVGEAIQTETLPTAAARADAITTAAKEDMRAFSAKDNAWDRAYLGRDAALRLGMTEAERIAVREKGAVEYAAGQQAYKDAKAALMAAKLADGQANFDALAKIRPMGTEADFKMGHSTNPVAKSIVQKAAPYYPKEWFDRARPINVGVLNPPRRARCSGDLVKVGSRDTEEQRSVAVHEVGHFMENYGGRSIKASEFQFMASRTQDFRDRPESLRTLTNNDGYKSHERTRTDAFASSYMGKTYGDTPTSNYELLTMGMQNLRNRTENDPATDKQYRAWLLGTLATA